MKRIDHFIFSNQTELIMHYQIHKISIIISKNVLTSEDLNSFASTVVTVSNNLF